MVVVPPFRQLDAVPAEAESGDKSAISPQNNPSNKKRENFFMRDMIR